MKESDELNNPFKHSEDKFLKIFYMNPSPIAVSFAYNDCFLDANASFLQVFGFKKEEVIGFTSKDLNLFVDYEDRKKAIELIKKRGKINGFETRMRCKDGNILTGLLFADIIELEERHYLITVFNDITEYKKTIGDLKDSESKYRSFFENAVEGICQTTPEGRYTIVNPALVRIMGYDSPEDMINSVKDISKDGYVKPEDRETFRNILAENGVVKGFEIEFYRKDKSIIWVSINARAVKDEAGKIICLEGTIEEITKHKAVEEQLKYEKIKFSVLIENAPFGMVMIDKDGRFIYVNSKFIEMFGYDLNDIPDGRTWFKKAYPDQEYRKTVISAWLDDLKDAAIGEKRPRVFNVTCKDGVNKIVNFIPVQLVSGMNIMTCEDITSRKIAEDAVRQTGDRLRNALAAMIQAMTLMVEKRDPYTAGHQKRVSRLARTIAQKMGLPNDKIDAIRIAAAIHDIGKISVPAEILSKPGVLSDIEKKLIMVHPWSGYDILKDVDLPYPIAEAVYQHHERLDGSGYPRGLKGEEILLEASILSVADVVEAIVSYRPYRPAKGIEAALEEIEKNRGILYDERVVDACLMVFKEEGFIFEYDHVLA